MLKEFWVNIGQKIEGLLSLSEITTNGHKVQSWRYNYLLMLMGNRGERPSISHKKY